MTAHESPFIKFESFVFVLVKIPTIKYDGAIIEEDTRLIHTGPKTVSCELYSGGPPLPEVLELLVLEGDEVTPTSRNDPLRSNDTCTWSYFPPLKINVNNITKKVRGLLHYDKSNELEHRNFAPLHIVNRVEEWLSYDLMFQVTLQCKVDYKDREDQFSPELTLVDSEYLSNTLSSVAGIIRNWFSCYGVCQLNNYGNFHNS